MYMNCPYTLTYGNKIKQSLSTLHLLIILWDNINMLWQQIVWREKEILVSKEIYIIIQIPDILIWVFE